MTDIDRRSVLRRVFTGVASAAAAVPHASVAGAEATALAMIERPIPSSGERLPVIGLGTWQTFDVEASAPARAPLEEVLRAFVELGGKVVDSSPMYGASEAVVGDLATRLRVQPQLFVATKVWTTGKAAGIRQMEESIRQLRVPKLDLMQVHNLVDVDAHLETLAAWKHEGRVRYIGVTHYTAGGHAEVARIVEKYPLDFMQINYSVGEREAEQRLLPLAREKGVAVIANRPFAGGNLFARLRSRPLPPWAASIDCDSWAQILLKFVVSHPAITCAIPATAKVDHLRDNMKAAYGRLPDQALRARVLTEIG